MTCVWSRAMTSASVSTAGRAGGPLRLLSDLGHLLTGRVALMLVAGIPLLWLALFLAAPVIEMLQISVSTAGRRVDPLFEWGEAGLVVNFTWEAYQGLWWDRDYYFSPVMKSFQISLGSTLVILLFAYPMAYWIARSSPRMQLILLTLVLLPFWTPSLLRIYALIGLLNDTGTINDRLIQFGLIDKPIRMMQTDFSVYAGMFISYLPLMILPLYAALVRLDWGLNEAAADQGASPFTIFRTITLPLSLPGVIAGCVLVFIPSFGEFVVPDRMGGPDHFMLGRRIWDEFFQARYWPGASALALLIVVVLVLPVMFYQMRQTAEEAGETDQQAQTTGGGQGS